MAGRMSEREMVLGTGEERKAYVKDMFNSIAQRYDFLNHFLSGGIDIYWRKKAISKLEVTESDLVLDLACGTGDFAFETAKKKICRVVGIDIAKQMLILGQEKYLQKYDRQQINFLNGDGEGLPLKSNIFQGITIAFGIRNMGSVQNALVEMYRVLRPAGQTIILEFSLPTNWFFRKLYLFYFNHILPIIGKLVSNDQQAYAYLPASVEKFPAIFEFENWMKEAGFKDIQHWKLLNGVAVIYKGIKKEK